MAPIFLATSRHNAEAPFLGIRYRRSRGSRTIDYWVSQTDRNATLGKLLGTAANRNILHEVPLMKSRFPFGVSTARRDKCYDRHWVRLPLCKATIGFIFSVLVSTCPRSKNKARGEC